MNALRTALAVVLLSCALAAPAAAGAGRFTPFGPPGAALPAQEIAVDPEAPSTVYAAAGPDLYRSDDGGGTWRRVASRPFLRLAAARTGSGTVLYGADIGQVLRSADGGRTWTPVLVLPVYVGDPGLLHVEVAPSQPSRLYVAAQTEVFRSDDGGDSWTRVYTGTTGIQSFAVDPRDADRLRLLDAARVVASRDGGRSWSAGVQPLYFGYPIYPQRLAQSPSSPDVVYVSGQSATCRSDDGAATFQCRYSPLSPDALLVDAADPLTVYALDPRGGVSVTRDGGGSWLRLREGLPRSLYRLPMLGLARDPVRGGVFVATPDRAVQRIAADGSWVASSLDGFLPGRANAMQIRPGRPREIYLALQSTVGYNTVGVLSRSRDGGATWQPLGTAGLAGVQGYVGSFLFDPVEPSTLYVGGPNFLYRSTDDGASWTPTTDGGSAHFAAVGRRTIVAAGCGVRRSTDAGATWRETLPCIVATDPENGSTFRIVTQLVADPATPTILYAVTLEGLESDNPHDPQPQYPYLYRSTDGGVTWKRLPVKAFALAIAPSRPQTVYATVPGGVARSDDGGRTFQVVGPVPTSIESFAVDARDPRTLYATFYPYPAATGIQRSTDGGATWQRIDTGLTRLGRDLVMQVIADPVVGGRIYGLPANGGVFVEDVGER